MAIPTQQRAVRRPESRSFLVLPENQFAFAAVQSLASIDPCNCRLVTLCGPSGVGKSHLARTLYEHADNSQIACHSASELFAHPTQSRQLAESTSLLICTNLESLRGRQQLQERAVAALDTFLASGVRIVLTCRRFPRDVQGLSPRLTNRCHGGLCVAIDPPSPASREKLLQHFAQELGIEIPPDAVSLLASVEHSSVRELRGWAIRLQQATSHTRRQIDRAFVECVLQGEPPAGETRLAHIAQAVARQFGISRQALLTPSRQSDVVTARQAAIYLARELTDCSYAEIGRFFAGRSHSTAVHACQKIQALLRENVHLAAMIDDVRRKLSSTSGPSNRRKPVSRRRASRRRTA